MSGSWTKCCHAKHAKGGLQMCIRSQTRQHAATIYDGPCIDNEHKIKHVSSKLCSGPWGIFQKTGGKNKKERIFEIMLVSVRKNTEKTKCRFVIIIYYVNRTMMRGTTILPSFPYLNIWGIYTGLWTRISVNLSNQDQYAASKDHFKRSSLYHPQIALPKYRPRINPRHRSQLLWVRYSNACLPQNFIRYFSYLQYIVALCPLQYH